MSVSAETPPRSPPYKTIAFWALKIVLALAFLAAGGAKLAGVPMLVSEFDVIGFGQWFRYFTAVVEIAGAVLMLLPAFSAFGALILTAVCVGAFFAQVLFIHQDFIHTIVMGGLTAFIAWAQRSQITGRA